MKYSKQIWKLIPILGVIYIFGIYYSKIQLLSQQYIALSVDVNVLNSQSISHDDALDTLYANQQTEFSTLNAKMEILDKSIDSDKKRKVQINSVLSVIKKTLPKGSHPLPNCNESLSSGELIRLSSAIVDMSNRYSVPISLILAVIKQESAFCNQAVSSAGARGYMQLMPETALQVALDIGMNASLWDTRDNIQLGTAYLSYLLSVFHGNTELAIRAYNAGPIHVKKVLSKEVHKYYDETENYFIKVMLNKEQYEALGIL